MADKSEFEAFLSSLDASVMEALEELTWNQTINLAGRMFDIYLKVWHAEIDKQAKAKDDPDYDEVWDNWGAGDSDGGDDRGDLGEAEAGQEEGGTQEEGDKW